MSVNLQIEYDKIYKYCYFKVNNKEAAEDLTQEVFLKYFSQTSYVDKGKLLPYLYTIAKNKCIDYYRIQNNQTLDDSEKFEDKTDEVITNIVVNTALSKLDNDLNEIVLLRFGSEFSINEISKMLNISRFAVYRKINKALNELEYELKEGFDE